jgi:thiol-disulfide isomerase/thioredoxin
MMTHRWVVGLLVISWPGCGSSPTHPTLERPAALLSRLNERPVIRPGASPLEARQEYLEERLRLADQLLQHPDADVREREWAALAKLQLLFRASREEPSKYQRLFDEFASSTAREQKPGLVTTTLQAMQILNQMENGSDEGSTRKLIDMVKSFPGNPASEMLLLNAAAALERQGRFAEGRVLCAQADEILDSQASRHRLAGFTNAFEILGRRFELTGKDLNGKPFDLAQLKGKVVLVDFWASWCEPCLRELPHLKEIYSRFKDRGFEIVGVCIDSEIEKARQHIAVQQIPWTQVYAKPALGFDSWSNPHAKKFGVTAIPASFLVDRKGMAIARNITGSPQQAELIEKAINQPR